MPYFRSAVKMAPIAQAHPDAHVFMQSYMVNLGGQVSRFVFITTSCLGAPLVLTKSGDTVLAARRGAGAGVSTFYLDKVTFVMRFKIPYAKTPIQCKIPQDKTLTNVRGIVVTRQQL